MDGATTSSTNARTVDAGRGLAWWTEAWALFTKAAGMWIVLAILLLVLLGVVSFVPILGALVSTLLLPVFLGSWMLAARKVQAGTPLEVGDLFVAFKGDKLTPLIIVGALLMAAVVVLALVAGMLGIGAVFGMMAGGHMRSAGGMMAAFGAGMLALLVGLLIGVLIGMATWFAPSLVVFRNLAPVDALRTSFAACLKNMLPFLVYGLIYIAASIVASIPFGLGWIVLAPVTLLTVHTSYEDVFGA
jgi:uncharacterized membrane protein